jgi:hypothetical protein
MKKKETLEERVKRIHTRILKENGYERDYDRKIIKIFEKINGFNTVYTKQLNAKTVTIDDLDNMIETYQAAVGDLKLFRDNWDK